MESSEQGAAAPSKKAAKKAEAKAKKEAQKAQRAAELAAAVASVELNDPAKDNYGRVTATSPAAFSPGAEEINLRSLGEEHDDKTVVLRAWLQNSRSQSAKMAFVELREEGSWTIQGVIMATAGGGGGESEQQPSEGKPVVSKPMVKWISGINPESFVVVEATVQRPLEPVKSCRVSGFELHITKCFLLAPAPAMLGMTLAAANRPVVNFSDEEVKPAEGEKEKEAEGVAPAASMLTHLDNIAMHKRAPVQQAIAVLQS